MVLRVSIAIFKRQDFSEPPWLTSMFTAERFFAVSAAIVSYMVVFLKSSCNLILLLESRALHKN